MKLSYTIAALALAMMLASGAGNAVAQCGEDCSHCEAEAAAAGADASCAAPATVTALPLDQLTPNELTFVKYLAGRVQKSDRVEFNIAEFSEATGLSEDVIMAFDDVRIRGGLISELNARGFDTSNMSFSDGGGGNCGEFGACSVDRNLMGASGNLLSSYESERATDGQTYIAWKAPDFTLPTTDGHHVTLSDYRGKPVAVVLMATHCNHCVDTAPMLSRLGEKYGDDLVVLPVAINAKSVDAVKSWADAVKADYPILVSTDKNVSEQFKVELVPTVVLINSKGYVTKKLITFKDEPTLDIAFAELTGRVQTGATGGSR